MLWKILIVPMVMTGYCRAKVQIELDLGWVHSNLRDDPEGYGRVVWVSYGSIGLHI